MSSRSHYAVEPPRPSTTVPSTPSHRRPSSPRTETLSPSSHSHRRSASFLDQDRSAGLSLAPPTTRSHRGASMSEYQDSRRGSRSSLHGEARSTYESRSVVGAYDDDRYRGHRSRHNSHSASQSAVGLGERDRYDRDYRNDYSHRVNEERRYSSDSSNEDRAGATGKKVFAAIAGLGAAALGAKAISSKLSERAQERDARLAEQKRHDEYYRRERADRERYDRDRDYDKRSHVSHHSHHSHHSSSSSHAARPVLPSRNSDDHYSDSERGRMSREQELLSRDRSRARDYQKEVSRDRQSYYEARASDDRLYPVHDDDYTDPYSGRNF